jgi:hypothetical protein
VTWIWVLVLDSVCVVLLVLEEISDSYAFSSSLLLPTIVPYLRLMLSSLSSMRRCSNFEYLICRSNLPTLTPTVT